MKYNVILLTIIILAFAGCREQDVDTAFEVRNGIYFAGDSSAIGEFIPLDSVSFSFGLRSAEIRFDTARIGVTFIGRKSPEVRKFKLRVIEKSSKKEVFTDMEEGVHYLPLKPEYEFAANSYKATVDLVIDRDHFSTVFQEAEEHRLVLQLLESDDFSVGIESAQELIVKINNYLAEPAWWNLKDFYMMENKLGFYHPEKWKALIFVNKGFENPVELPFEKNNGVFMQNRINEAQNLDPWWPKLDSDMNAWIYFDRIEYIND